MWKKVEDALTIVDRDLGFSEVGIRYPEQTKVFLYIAEKKIGGLLLAESIPSGYRVLQEKSKLFCLRVAVDSNMLVVDPAS